MKRIGTEKDEVLALCKKSSNEFCVGIKCPPFTNCFPEANEHGYIEVVIVS